MVDGGPTPILGAYPRPLRAPSGYVCPFGVLRGRFAGEGEMLPSLLQGAARGRGNGDTGTV